MSDARVPEAGPLPDLWRGGPFSLACAAGDLRIAAGLLAQHGGTSPSGTLASALVRERFYDACAGGNLDAARWLARTLGLTAAHLREQNDYALLQACSSGNLNLVIWLVRGCELGPANVCAAAPRVAAAAGHADVAAWLVRTFALGDIAMGGPPASAPSDASHRAKNRPTQGASAGRRP
jgi:hypothetical protein